MNTNKTTALRVVGLTLTTLPLYLTNQSDLTKGLISGMGIGLLLLSFISKIKAQKAI